MKNTSDYRPGTRTPATGRSNSLNVFVRLEQLEARETPDAEAAVGAGVAILPVASDTTSPSITANGTLFNYAKAGAAVCPTATTNLQGYPQVPATGQVGGVPYSSGIVVGSPKYVNGQGISASQYMVQGDVTPNPATLATSSATYTAGFLYFGVLGCTAGLSAETRIRNNPGDPPGIAAARAYDPWHFKVAEPTDITVSISLNDYHLSIDPGEIGSADVEVFWAFGGGSGPDGGSVMDTGTFTKHIDDEDSVESSSPMTLLSNTYTLQPGTEYWLAVDVAAAAQLDEVPRRTKVVVTDTPDPSYTYQPVDLTAVVTSNVPNVPPPTGLVQFWAHQTEEYGPGITTKLGTDTLTADDKGVATLKTGYHPFSLGDWTVYATYAGDEHHAPGTGETPHTAVWPPTTLTSSQNPAREDESFTITGTVPAVDLPPSPREMTFFAYGYNGDAVLGVGMVDDKGVATVTVAPYTLQPGTYTITGAWIGDSYGYLSQEITSGGYGGAYAGYGGSGSGDDGYGGTSQQDGAGGPQLMTYNSGALGGSQPTSKPDDNSFVSDGRPSGGADFANTPRPTPASTYAAGTQTQPTLAPTDDWTASDVLYPAAPLTTPPDGETERLSSDGSAGATMSDDLAGWSVFEQLTWQALRVSPEWAGAVHIDDCV